MTIKHRNPDSLEVLIIDFNPVVGEGLQTIMTKDENIEMDGDVQDGDEALLYMERAKDNG